jgi:hypothetical protein
MGNNMVYILFDEKGNVKMFKTEYKLEEFFKNHEGIYYLVELFANTICVSKIHAHDGEFERVKEGFIEMKD